MATFETKDEEESVLGLFKERVTEDDPTYKAHYFISIGGTKKDKDYWYWAESGEKIDYEIGWLPGEPNNAHQEDECMNLFYKDYSTTGKYLINDDPCSKIGYYLCENEERETSSNPSVISKISSQALHMEVPQRNQLSVFSIIGITLIIIVLAGLGLATFYRNELLTNYENLKNSLRYNAFSNFV